MSENATELFKNYGIVSLTGIEGTIEGAALRLVTCPDKPEVGHQLIMFVYLENIQRPEMYHIMDVEDKNVEITKHRLFTEGEQNRYEKMFKNSIEMLILLGLFVIQHHEQ